MSDAIDTIKSYYEANMDKNLPDYSLLGWESEQAQQLRFDMVMSKVPVQGRKILDVGCGVGSFPEYLEKLGIEADYTGVDILESMIQRAKQKNLKGRFVCCDLFKENPFQGETFDVIYVSGIFNLNLNNNMEFLRKALDTFLTLSGDVIAFNLLSNTSTDQEDKYFYYDMEEVRKLFEESFPGCFRDIGYYGGYLQNDFTIICRKKGTNI